MADSLLPYNASPQERALEATTARVSDVPVLVRESWNPATCPAPLLPWLAWAFSVDEWDADWTEAKKRAVIASSVRAHKRKGTPAAIKEIIGLIFGTGEILEPWHFGGSPHTFKIATEGHLASAQSYAKLIDLVDAAKPVRSWLIGVQVKRKATLGITLAGYTHTGIKFALNHQVNPQPGDARVRFAGITHAAKTMTVLPAGLAISLPIAQVSARTVQHIARTTFINRRT